MTIEKARRICDVLNDYAETIHGERGVACLNAIEAFEDDLDADERCSLEETQLGERVEELTRFVIGKSIKRKGLRYANRKIARRTATFSVAPQP